MNALYFVTDWNRDVTVQNWNTLMDNSWIDRKTRGLFFEMVVYSKPLNYYGVVYLVAEVSNSGRVVTSNEFLIGKSHYIPGFYSYEMFIRLVEFVWMGLTMWYSAFKICSNLNFFDLLKKKRKLSSALSSSIYAPDYR